MAIDSAKHNRKKHNAASQMTAYVCSTVAADAALTMRPAVC